MKILTFISLINLLISPFGTIAPYPSGDGGSYVPVPMSYPPSTYFTMSDALIEELNKLPDDVFTTTNYVFHNSSLLNIYPVTSWTTTSAVCKGVGWRFNLTTGAKEDLSNVNFTLNTNSPSYQYTYNWNYPFCESPYVTNLDKLNACNVNVKYNVTVSAIPSNGGTVSGGGSYDDGSSVTVTASANSGYRFVNWTENNSEVSTSANYTFDISSDRSLVANFDLIPTTYNFFVAGGDSDTVTSCSYILNDVNTSFDCSNVTKITAIPYGASVTVNATNSNKDFYFGSLQSVGSSTVNTRFNFLPYNFSISDTSITSSSIQLYWQDKPTQNYNVTVSASPSQGGTVFGGGSFQNGTSVTVSATPNDGYDFVGWFVKGGDLNYPLSTDFNYTFTIRENLDLIALFSSKPTGDYSNLVFNGRFINIFDYGINNQVGHENIYDYYMDNSFFGVYDSLNNILLFIQSYNWCYYSSVNYSLTFENVEYYSYDFSNNTFTTDLDYIQSLNLVLYDDEIGLPKTQPQYLLYCSPYMSLYPSSGYFQVNISEFIPYSRGDRYYPVLEVQNNELSINSSASRLATSYDFYGYNLFISIDGKSPIYLGNHAYISGNYLVNIANYNIGSGANYQNLSFSKYSYCDVSCSVNNIPSSNNITTSLDGVPTVSFVIFDLGPNYNYNNGFSGVGSPSGGDLQQIIDILIKADTTDNDKNNDILSDNVDNVNDLQDSLFNDFNDNINNLDTDTSSFISSISTSANWVRARFDDLTLNNPFGTYLQYTLLIGFAILIIGRRLN